MTDHDQTALLRLLGVVACCPHPLRRAYSCNPWSHLTGTLTPCCVRRRSMVPLRR